MTYKHMRKYAKKIEFGTEDKESSMGMSPGILNKAKLSHLND